MKKTQSQYSFGLASNRKMFRKGMTEGIPIGHGLFGCFLFLGDHGKKGRTESFCRFFGKFF